MTTARGRSSYIDGDVATYALAHTSPPDEVQRSLQAVTAERTGAAAGMQIGHDQAVLMENLARAMGARRAVEVGTFTGYSALALARGMGTEGRLLCCDVSEEWTAIAREHWAKAGVADRIDLRLGPGLDTLRSLPAEERFDLAFIDADKEGYLDYYEEILLRLRRGGMVLADNTLWGGRILDPEVRDADTVAIRAFNDALAADDRVRAVILTIGDGVTMAQKV
ncbi:MAG: class I SAM-dependent methyltransferase [Actinomycetota bacterium]|nr:class I SAM-dependent methyltransferase [Actinomycetota bacterium]